MGNSPLLVNFDRDYQVRDIHHLHLGRENDSDGRPFRIGVWSEGRFAWLGPEWKIERQCGEESLVTNAIAHNEQIRVEPALNEAVDFHEPVFVRRIQARNLSGHHGELRVYFYHDFLISGTQTGDTGYYDAKLKSVVHYKGERSFSPHMCTSSACGPEQFACGRKSPRLEGTWRDAEDGTLASSWQPWVHEGQRDLPIQEDETAHADWYRSVVAQMRTAMFSRLFYKGETRPARIAADRHGRTDYELDMTQDSSLYAALLSDICGCSDPEITATAEALRERLWVNTEVGGLARYAGDYYHRVGHDLVEAPANSWFVTTLWYAQYLMMRPKGAGELRGTALPILQWVVNHALPSGILGQQVNPETNEPLSVSPLIWSHSTTVLAVLGYFQERHELS